MQFYPIKFHPILKERIWGGQKLVKTFGKNSELNGIGESWEITDVDGDVSIVENGFLKGKSLKELISLYKSHFVGNKVYEEFGDKFPILIKFIDAKLPLSIQVHPNNKLAKERHNSLGKNEMWYIMDVDEDANIIVGFNQEMNEEKYLKSLKEKKILDVINKEKVAKGDTFYIRTGKIHAIGAGTVLAEIQQTSNITYRIFDYERKDENGNQRELHTELALEAIDYTSQKSYKTEYELIENKSSKLVHSPYFKTNIIALTDEIIKDYTNLDSFVIYMCVEGSFNLTCNEDRFFLSIGETILLPAQIDEVTISSKNAKILEVYL